MATGDATQKASGDKFVRATTARLHAVQAIYQHALNPQNVKLTVNEYLSFRAGMTEDEETFVSPDGALFTRIVEGVHENFERLQEVLTGLTMTEAGEPRKLEMLLTSTLLAGLYELLLDAQTDAPIVINDYVEITKGFYAGKEPSLVNAVLDKAQKL
ncbi:MAG: transcription antitermination factor NusB [Pseudobdellovibrionaceae bacterium]